MTEHIERMAEACQTKSLDAWANALGASDAIRAYVNKRTGLLDDAARLLRALAAAPADMSVQAFREMHAKELE